MKTFFAVAALCIFATNALADQSVSGYHRSSPNGTVTDNYSFKGNVNPYTGKVGTNYYRHDKTSPYYIGPASGHN
ncbi:MAG: hypothetical protein ACLP0B_17065 [Steroidobacteraceae bacterium]